MAFVVTDIEIVVIFGVVLIAVYVVGSYWKHKTLTSYAHWFENEFGPKAKVQFASYGHAGLRVKCEMNDSSGGYRALHFAITLGARENLMYYPLVSLMHDFDRLNCWGVVERVVRSSLLIINTSDKKQIQNSENNANLRRLDLPELSDLGYVVYASNKDHAKTFITQASVTPKLKQLRDVELIELDMMASTIRVASKLRRETLPDLTNFVLSLGGAV